MEISLYRIMLFGQEIDKLKKFYIDNFGFSLIEEIRNEWAVLKAGQTEIALHKIGQSKMNESEIPFKVENNTKLVFKITGNLPALRQKLIDNGVLLQEIKSFKGFNSLFCDGQDFEGNIFQLEQKLD